LISICGTSVLIDDDAVDEDFNGDCIGVTPIGRVEVLAIGRILSGFAAVDFIGGDGTLGWVC